MTDTFDRLEAITDYVLESEHDDFQEYPSDNHVYFHAYAVFYGELEARKMLKLAEENKERWDDAKKQLIG
jgi:hypothetical protein